MKIEENVSLRPYNTFGIDEPAQLLARVSSLEELQLLHRQPEFRELPKLYLGGGSNLLLTQPFAGMVVKLEIRGTSIIRESEEEIWVKAMCGENWHQFVLHTLSNRWYGLENLSLIPGNVGTAPIQNIGAYGVEIKDYFEELEAYLIDEDRIETFDYTACKFGYRDSIFKGPLKNKAVIVSVTFRLKKKNHVLRTEYGAISDKLTEMGIENPTPQDVSRAVIAIRKSKLPDPALVGNAGSFFKNPTVSREDFERLKADNPTLPGYPTEGGVKLAAGWLIERAGWKGYREGHFGVNPLQALVLVNYGGSKGADLARLSRKIQADVKAKFGVNLEAEVNIL